MTSIMKTAQVIGFYILAEKLVYLTSSLETSKLELFYSEKFQRNVEIKRLEAADRFILTSEKKKKKKSS